jgi:rhodanese-related sulfurtransferase
MSSPDIPQISPSEAARLIAERGPEHLQLIDVREPQEATVAAIAGFRLVPLSAYADWADSLTEDLDPHSTTLVLCHHGMRSYRMCQWLQAQGFTDVRNIAGGIDEWSLTVDAQVPRY